MTADRTADAYNAAAEAWGGAPARVYGRLAAAMLDHSPITLPDTDVLDVGAGTGVACDAALDRGARRAVATDVAAGMLRRRTPGVPAAVADAARLPFRANAFDLVTAGFCLSHLPDPAAALVEWRRVARAVVASAFAPGPPHPAKTRVDEAMQRLGYTAPAWYRRLKDEVSPLVEEPHSLAALARSAGFGDVSVANLEVDVGLDTPEEIARWRLGMAHLAPWLARLPADRRREAERAAVHAAEGLGRVSIAIQVVSGT